jgi:hypothetical protein
MDGGRSFEVVHEEWMTAGKGVTEASDVLADGVNAFGRKLAGTEPFGSDELGRALYERSFVAQRDGLLRDLSAAVNLLRGMGAGLFDTAGRYAEADDTALVALGGRPESHSAPGETKIYALPSLAGRLPSTVPPPEWWERAAWFFEKVGVSCSWPDGDVDGVRALEDAATTMAAAVRTVTADLAWHADRVTGYGDTTAAFRSAAHTMHGEVGPLADIERRCAELAAYCRSGAGAIVSARWHCEASALYVLALMYLLSVYGPLLEAVLVPLIRLEGLALRIVLRLIRDAVLGGAFGGGLDVIGQLFQTGKIDLGRLGGALVQGVLAGALMGAGNTVVPAMLRGGPALTRLADAMASPGPWGTLSRLVVGGTVGTGAIAATGALTGHGWDWEAAAEAGFGMALLGAGAEALSRRSLPKNVTPEPTWLQQSRRDLAWIRTVDPDIRTLLAEFTGDRAPVPERYLGEARQFLERYAPPGLVDRPENTRMVDEAVATTGRILQFVDSVYGRNDAPRLHDGTYWRDTPFTYNNGDHARTVIRDSLRYVTKVEVEEPGTYSDRKVLDTMVAAAGHDIVQGHGRGIDERVAAAVTAEGMRAYMPETYAEERGRYAYNSILATTFGEKTKTQDIDPARGDVEGQLALAVGDLLVLNENGGLVDGFRIAAEDFAKPDRHGPYFQEKLRAAGIDLTEARTIDYLRAYNNDPELREWFNQHASGQLWFLENQKPVDPRVMDWFPGRARNVALFEEFVPLLVAGKIDVFAYTFALSFSTRPSTIGRHV